ncbi:peroxiredoxin [Thiogranum longum]|uniref:Peroxiredoxin n=1 Tax=Thiogranum longum TaxID=1537524 RepID=A0A4R1HAX9_9GAMM|nr:TlpA disulfide reductase family protein [Thiogranum longum]TCK17300.1 peroxiredoxin [Thiogranum longum]
MKKKSKLFTAHRRKHPMRNFLTAAALVLTCFASSTSYAALGHTLSRLPTPVPAPDFTLEDMDGEKYTLSSLRGKVIMINFWATWCPPCREEIPSMEAVYQSLRDKDFIVLAINQWESPDHVFSYMGQLDVYPTFPILFDRDSSVSDSYGVKGLPTTLLIDKQGRVVYRAVGGRNFNHPDVRALIQQLIDEAGSK